MPLRPFLKPLFPALLCAGLATLAALSQDNEEVPLAERPDDFHIYLVIGEPPPVDPGDLPEDAATVFERCKLLNADDKWEPASAPLNRHSSIRNKERLQTLSPAYGFVKTMLEGDENITIGLVVNSGQGANPEHWGMKTTNYREARRRTRIASKEGTLKGILWYGAGSKSPLLTDLDHWKTLITSLRADLRSLNLPVVLGEVPGAPSANTQLTTLDQDVHITAIASISDLVPAGRKSFTAESMIRFGKRYAEQMMILEAHLDEDGPFKSDPIMPLIDMHVHAMSNKPGGLDPVAAWMERNNVERCITSPLGQSRATTPEQRKIMLANFRKYRGKIDRFCMLEPGEVATVEEAVRILSKEKAEGAIGFGEHYGRDLMFDDPKNLLLYEACEQVGLPVMFHIDSSKNMVEAGMRRVERVLEMFPDCKIIAHAYWWLQFPDGTCDRMLRKYPNLYADVSGIRMAGILNRDRAYTREFLILHQNRILFASDAGWWSFGKPKAERELQFSLFEQLDLPEEVLRKIYRTNAQRLFGFPDAEPERK